MTIDHDAARMVRVHQKISAKRKELRKAYEAEDAKLKEALVSVEAGMLAFLNDTNQKTAKTDTGLFYWQEKIIPQGDNWGELYDWVKANDAFDIFERRIKISFIKDYMEEHEKSLPPGVVIYREREICVRKNQS